MADTPSATVLILEDESISRLALTKRLEKETDYRILSAGDGQSAVDIAERTRIDVLLADILMKGIDGITAAARIAARQDTVIIFVTASTDPDTLARAEALGPLAVLGKPPDSAELVDLVRDSIAARLSPAEEELPADFLLDTLYDTARIGMCVTDENRRFVKVNRAYCRTYGYSTEELLGEEFTKVLPPQDRPHAARMHDEFIRGDLRELPADWRVQRSDGEIRNIYVTAGRMIGTDGRPYKVTTVADVTAWKQYDADLAEQVEEKQMLLREVHHRVKNNLNTLSSLLSLQLDQHRDDARIADVLTVSINRIKTMGSIYERLHQSNSHTRVDLPHYIERLTQDLLATITAHASVRMSLEVEPQDVAIDTGVSIGLVINELVTNSAKHAFSGDVGTISLAVRTAEPGYAVEVADSGAGIPEDMDIDSGNTLGFQLLHAIAGQHGGTVELLDRAEARVRVTLPGR
jgi:PAS domain S-box-containing protein